VIGGRGRILGEPGEFRPVHGKPPGGIGGRLNPATVRPSAQGVSADPQKARSLFDPENRIPRL
jgi:hypothetical protein